MAVITLPYPVPSSPDVDDEQLLKEAAEGDSTALELLFHRYRGPAYRVAYRLLGNDADALDAVQNGFIKALTHLKTFQGRSSFKTWLLRVVSNAALDLGRQRGRREALSLEAVEVKESTNAPLLVPDQCGQQLERAELRAKIEQALLALSQAQRQTFVLHVDAGLSYREVAEVMDVSIGTVMSRLFYARQKLKALLASVPDPT